MPTWMFDPSVSKIDSFKTNFYIFMCCNEENTSRKHLLPTYDHWCTKFSTENLVLPNSDQQFLRSHSFKAGIFGQLSHSKRFHFVCWACLQSLYLEAYRCTSSQK